MFQFHKVRLKGRQCPHQYLQYCQFQFHKVRLKAGQVFQGRRFPEFQFHKVRLKARKTTGRAVRHQVSIP